MLLGYAVVALASSVAWGAADFVAALAARRMPSPAVVAWSQAIAAVLLTVVILVRAEPFVGPWIGSAVLAGLSGALALACYYQALASGTMGVVAPIASLGVVVPVVVGLLGGERAGTITWVGVALAVVGVVLASGPEITGAAAAGLKPVGLALVAGLGFGTTMVFLAHGAEQSLLGTLWGMRVASVTAFVLVAIALRPKGWGRPRPELPRLTFVAVADAAANGLYAVAGSRGLVSVASVLGSLYPLTTIALARWVLDERLRRIQLVGVGCTMVGVAAIAAG